MESLVNRIGRYVQIKNDDFKDIEDLPHRMETRRAGQEIVVEGETINYVFVIESGWAIRFRMIGDGRRQILNFMLPGDCFDMMSLNNAQSDHSVSAATDVTLRRIKASDFKHQIARNARLAASFWWVAIQEESILREQIIRVGRRSAIERVGHLILELNRRVSTVTGELDNHLNLPVPQSLLADALGLSVVHISRTLSRLRALGMIQTTTDGIQILDREKLSEMCDFDSRYLHLDKFTF